MAWQSFGTEQRGTTRTMGLLYIILILLLNDEVHSAFKVTKSQIPLSWETALHHCHKIRSNLTFAIPVVDLSSMTVEDKIDLQGEAWVGYVQIYEYFLFIVCVPLSEIVSSVSATFNIGRLDNRPGMCYSLCGLQGYIGLQGGLCYCIETRTFSSPDMHSVNSSCENPLHCANGMLCGSIGYIEISVYKQARRIQGTPVYEGFLKNSKEGITLEFVHAGRFSRKMFVVCMSDQHSTEKEYHTNEPEETPITSATSEAPTTSRIPVLTVVLPVGLAALASIPVVTLIVVCWRRRKEKATKNEEASNLKYAETVAPLISETQQMYYEHEKETLNKLKENNQRHVSSVYDSLKEYNAPFSAATGNLYDTSNFNIGDGTYAVTFSANTLRQVVQANCYDHVRMKKTNNGKYDHVELQDQRNNVNDISTHDQGNALDLDSTYYDTFQEKFKLHPQLEGNVYNTANFHPTK